jgi:hypothetical protein
MIGGHDILILTSQPAAIDVCLRVIRHFWPKAVFENAAGNNGAESYDSFAIDCSNEIFAYRDSASAVEWNEKGADPSLCNSMIHILLSGRTITLVVDDPDDPQIAEILRTMRSELGPNANGLPMSSTSQGAYKTPLSAPNDLQKHSPE